ncbi:GNAT family N-acetyltransferase [Psychrobacillus psychrodurans]|uniref:GNAT family N-acetyltransferase n=1 Tax=Psychrobacillus psychrodurans TaxID=126157 RepID=UPI0008ECC2C6|nr:GNAT family protein [Psychrobacillus psychrodurans]MCZ8541888.1 GNAT family N-acetyltransferase [Psychrobacillus psychrodurans]SFN11018.1 Protein N-acetyltransferase, RimJ/RimL family [Psychrobacillus psychrodurans]
MKIDTNIILEGDTVTLFPLEMKYKEQVYEAIKNPDIWKYTWREVKTFDDIEQILLIAVQNKDDGKQLPFIIKDKLSGEIIGTTRIGDIDTANRNVEIGWTWLTPSAWRTKVNTECKFLMLQYCFEELKVLRVQFSISGQNIRSQRAVERIGAVKEGTFRKHRIKADGTIHDNIFYSIVDTEWIDVKGKLINLLEKKY